MTNIKRKIDQVNNKSVVIHMLKSCLYWFCPMHHPQADVPNDGFSILTCPIDYPI